MNLLPGKKASLSRLPVRESGYTAWGLVRDSETCVSTPSATGDANVRAPGPLGPQETRPADVPGRAPGAPPDPEAQERLGSPRQTVRARAPGPTGPRGPRGRRTAGSCPNSSARRGPGACAWGGARRVHFLGRWPWYLEPPASGYSASERGLYRIFPSSCRNSPLFPEAPCLLRMRPDAPGAEQKKPGVRSVWADGIHNGGSFSAFCRHLPPLPSSPSRFCTALALGGGGGGELAPPGLGRHPLPLPP